MNDLMQWWNAIYWIPLCLSLLWILLSALSGYGHATHTVHGHGDIGHGHVDAGHGHADVGHGHVHAGHGHTDVGHGQAHTGHADASHSTPGHGLHGGHHVGAAHSAHAHAHDASHDHDATSPRSPTSGALAATWSARLLDILGIGRVPITLIVGIGMLVWGTFGLMANSLLRHAGMSPAVFIGPSLIGTFLATSIVTRLTVGVVGRFMPTTETFAISTYDLVGQEGVVVYEVTENVGTVQVTDAYGTVHRRMAKIDSGSTQLRPNSRIIVIGVDDAGDRLIVKEFNRPEGLA